MKFSHYLGLLARSENTLADSFRQVSENHGAEPDVHFLCQTLAAQCDEHRRILQPIIDKYGEEDIEDEAAQSRAQAIAQKRPAPLGLLDDLQDLYMIANFVDMCWTMVGQVAQGLRDKELLAVVDQCESETAIHLKWLTTRMKQAAPQALIVGG